MRRIAVLFITAALLVGLSPAAHAAYLIDYQWQPHEVHTLYIGDITWGVEPNDVKWRVRCNSPNARFVGRLQERHFGIWWQRGNPIWTECDEYGRWINVYPNDASNPFRIVVERGYYGSTPINGVLGGSVYWGEAG